MVWPRNSLSSLSTDLNSFHPIISESLHVVRTLERLGDIYGNFDNPQRFRESKNIQIQAIYADDTGEVQVEAAMAEKINGS